MSNKNQVILATAMLRHRPKDDEPNRERMGLWKAICRQLAYDTNATSFGRHDFLSLCGYPADEIQNVCC